MWLYINYKKKKTKKKDQGDHCQPPGFWLWSRFGFLGHF